MKILLVQPYALGPGHYDAYTKRLCMGFCQLGVDVTLITAAGTREGWENQLPIDHMKVMKRNSHLLFALEKGKSIRVIDRIMRRLRFLWTSLVVEKFALSHYLNNDYDALHFIDTELITLAILFLLYGKPSNVFLTIPAPYSIPAQQKSIYRYTYDPLRRMVSKWLFKFIGPITHSQYVRNSLFDFNLVSKDTIVPIIPWGIDVPKFKQNISEVRQKLGIGDSRPVFGFFGYLLPQKGFNFLLKSWSRINPRCILLALVHSDKPGEEKAIKKQIVKTGIRNRVIFKFGFVSEQELALYYQACDAILLPYKKTFKGESGTMALALSYNIPVIVANVGRVGEVIRQNNLGIVFEPESPSALKEAIDQFLNLGKEEINRIKKNIRLYTESHSWEEVSF